ncbi:MAG: phosphotransferase family protein [Candidatus Krumholzibacteriia bacterium]
MKFAVPEGTADPAAIEQAVSPNTMLEAFQRYLPPRDRGSWTRCELERVRYRPGKSWRILYRLWKDGEPGSTEAPYYFYAEFLPPARSLRRFLDLKGRGGPGAPSGFVAELNMIYWRFPADPRLLQLPTVYREGSWKVVSYVPTMSCVLSGQYGGEPTILKLYRDDRVERIGHVIQALHDAGVTSPRLLHIDKARRLLVLEHIPGVLFWSDPVVHLRRDVMGAMARELATLHDSQLPEATLDLLPRVSHLEREWQRFRQASVELAQAFPSQGERLERLQAMLEPPQGTPATVLLHGDFHPAQFLIHHGTPRLIDYDTVCLGDPMYDLARFASHLYYKGWLYGQETRDIEKAVSAFRSAYIAAAAVRFSAPCWFWHLAVSLVAKRAHRVLTRLEADAEPLVTHLITIAEQNAVSIVHS